MKLIDGEIYLFFEDVAEACGLTYASLRTLCSRGMAQWQTTADPADRRRSLIRYNTLSSKYQEYFKTKYTSGIEPIRFIGLAPVKKESTLLDNVLDAYEDYQSFLRYYNNVTAADERKTQKARKYLARAASCMSAIHIYYSQNNISPSNRKPIIEVSNYLMEEKESLWPKPYGYMKCSVRHIQESLKALQEGASIDEVISQPRVGNENRMGESHAYIKGAVARIITSGKNPTIAEVARKVQYLCTIEDKGKPSESTIYKYVADMKAITSLQRFGEANKASQNQRFSTPSARAEFAGDCWEMDGTRVQIQPFKTVSSSGAENQLAYLYIVAIRDVYSGAYLGWSFGVAESGLMYREALKMAVSLAGYLPYELRHDKFPGHNSDEMERLFESLTSRGVKLTKTSTATGKAAVERAFGTLQSVFESDRREWVGQGIRSSRDYARPTAEYLAKTHKQLKSEGFTWEEAWRVENEVVMTYNYTPISLYSKKYRTITQSPIELHDADTDRPNVIKVETYDIADLFWATRKISIRNYALNLEVNRTSYTYMLTDEKYYDIIRNHTSVLVKFDASDMSEVMIFDALYNTYLNSVTEFAKPNLYGPNADFGIMAVEKEKQKALKQKLNAELQQVKSACEDDVLSIQIAHLIPKANAELAEQSAMANYWRNTVPVETLPYAKPSRKAKVETQCIASNSTVTERSRSGNSMEDILNQL
jgi:hypothetical protein